MSYSNIDWDHLAEDKCSSYFLGWLRLLRPKWPELPMSLASKHRPGVRAVEGSDMTTGACNICCFVTFEDGVRAVVRFPIFGRSRFRQEKTLDEASVMQYLSRYTRIRLPSVLGIGNWGCGPYLVTSYIEGVLLSKVLRNPDVRSPSLDPNVSREDLSHAYCAMSPIVVTLSLQTFSSIGGIRRDGESLKWKVCKRPLTITMNELVRVGNIPPSVFADRTFDTANEYFEELANLHLIHLRYQRNDAVQDEEDCRKKYIARCLFRKIAREFKAHPGPFPLYCDDLRPSNVLVPESKLMPASGVIDWEFTYAAPVEFTRCAPWWLLFESPEAWESDLKEFLVRFRPRLELFLKALWVFEDIKIRTGHLKEEERLSGHMAESMENGLFWFCLAARKSYMFDDIYWTFLDEMHFGPLNSLDERLALLSQEEQDELDELVKMKMEQKEEVKLDEHLTLDEIIEL